jgi:hypothetical protein
VRLFPSFIFEATKFQVRYPPAQKKISSIAFKHHPDFVQPLEKHNYRPHFNLDTQRPTIFASYPADSGVVLDFVLSHTAELKEEKINTEPTSNSTSADMDFNTQGRACYSCK